MIHTDLVEIHYHGIHGTSNQRGKDVIQLKFGDKVVGILSSHFNLETFDWKDKYKNTINVQQWVVKANGLESFLYKGVRDE